MYFVQFVVQNRPLSINDCLIFLACIAYQQPSYNTLVLVQLINTK